MILNSVLRALERGGEWHRALSIWQHVCAADPAGVDPRLAATAITTCAVTAQWRTALDILAAALQSQWTDAVPAATFGCNAAVAVCAKVCALGRGASIRIPEPTHSISSQRSVALVCGCLALRSSSLAHLLPVCSVFRSLCVCAAFAQPRTFPRSRNQVLPAHHRHSRTLRDCRARAPYCYCMCH